MTEKIEKLLDKLDIGTDLKLKEFWRIVYKGEHNDWNEIAEK